MPSLTKMRSSRGGFAPGRGKLFRFFLFLLLFTVAAYVFLQSSFFEVRKIAISGNRKLTTSQVLQLAGLGKGKNIFKMDLREASEKLATHPYIKDVEISRRLPYTVQVQIIERIPVALASGNGGFVEVDGEGVYLAKSRDMLKANLPIITTVDTAKAGPGEKINDHKLNLGLAFVAGMGKDLRNIISEVNVNDPEGVLLYTIDGIEIRAGNRERLEEKLETISVLLKNYGKQVVYIDISFDGPPVVKTNLPSKGTKGEKEEQPSAATGETVTADP